MCPISLVCVQPQWSWVFGTCPAIPGDQRGLNAAHPVDDRLPLLTHRRLHGDATQTLGPALVPVGSVHVICGYDIQ